MRALALGVMLVCGACADFETPGIVLDTRVLGMQATPPEVLVAFDPTDPPEDLSEIELVPVEVCGLVADPELDRQLIYNMTVCAPTGDDRCNDPDAPFVELTFGTVDDPETGDPQICGTVPGDASLFPVLEDAIRGDSLSGFGGIELQVELVVRGADQPFEDALFASKGVLYAPEIPEGRVANENPSLEKVTAAVDGGEPVDLPLGECGEIEPLEVTVGSEVELEPVEPEGVREDYVLPTFDGDFVELTENLRYAWYATAGSWSPENSGGPRDVGGNEPPLDSTWTAAIEEVGDGVDVRVWIVQRDERGGQAWYESCLRVVP